VVDLSNLQRQILHATSDVGKAKVFSAEETLSAINPNVKLIAYKERVTSENVREIIRDYDIILDGSDNFPTRYLINDACFFANPNIRSILQFDSQVWYLLCRGPCYHASILNASASLSVMFRSRNTRPVQDHRVLQATEALKKYLG
jgi:adenylyltransferase/sulfurtransferase